MTDKRISSVPAAEPFTRDFGIVLTETGLTITRVGGLKPADIALAEHVVRLLQAAADHRAQTTTERAE
jgi:hypothetical protein